MRVGRYFLRFLVGIRSEIEFFSLFVGSVVVLVVVVSFAPFRRVR